MGQLGLACPLMSGALLVAGSLSRVKGVRDLIWGLGVLGPDRDDGPSDAHRGASVTRPAGAGRVGQALGISEDAIPGIARSCGRLTPCSRDRGGIGSAPGSQAAGTDHGAPA